LCDLCAFVVNSDQIMPDDLPALLGGTAVRKEGPPAWPFPDANVAAAVMATMADGSWGEYLGPHVPKLEAALCESFGVPHAITCASGTLAVETALRAVGVGPGDEVIIGAYDFEPSFLSIHAVGATPVLVDVAAASACLDCVAFEAAITPATKAVIASHLHGGLVPMSRVMAIAERNGIRVVEDAAQACGAIIEGKPAGTWGDVGVLSFGGSKMLSAGRGGAVITRHAECLQRARLFLTRGIQHWAAMSQLQAAALIPQLSKLPERTRQRNQSVIRLVELLRDVPGVRPFAATSEPEALATETPKLPGYFKLGFYLDEAIFGISREVFVKALRAEGIAFDPGFRALHVGRAAGRYKAAGPLPNAEIAGRTVVCLHHPVLLLGPAEIEQVAAAVRKTYRNATRLR
jgi:dTDP-4-amino-4,6-dideoxygalactose transaminase